MKKEGLKVDKLAGKQFSDKILPAAIDIAGSKIADKITSLQIKPDDEESPEKRQKIIDDLRLI